MKLEHSLTPYTKINSKWIKDLSLRPDTIKLLEENINSGPFDISLSYIFFWICLLRQGKQKQNKQMGRHQTKKLLHRKETVKKVKRQLTELEKIFANNISNKGLISKVHKKVIQPNGKKTNIPI